MLPFGPIKRLSLAGLAAATLGATASSASADDVWLWACHGPAGQPLPGLLGSTGAESAGVEQSCAEQGGGFVDGLRMPGPAFLQLGVPSSTTLTGIRISRQTSLADGQRYALRTSAGRLESQVFGGTLAPDPADYLASGDFAKVEVSGPPSAAGGAAVAALALRVTDDEPPRGGGYGGWRSPASDTLDITVPARDIGVGLMSATAYLDDTPVATARFGRGSCNDLSPGPGTPVDLDYALVGQSDDLGTTPVSAVGCPRFGTATLPVDTRGVADGNHTITITATDLAGNTATLVDKLATEILNNVDRGQASRTLSIGTSGPTAVPSPGGGGSAGSGGVAGATATSCRSPKLSMFLAQKPLRVSKGVAVLRRGARYRFSGRLTCVIDGKRRSAPKRTRVDIFNTIGKRTVETAGTTAAGGGKLSIILAFKSSRTLIFRVTSTQGQRSQVKIRLRVVKKPKRR